MMKRIFFLFLFFFLLACNDKNTKGITERLTVDTIIHNVTVIDAKNGLQKDRTVFIKGNKIQKVGPSNEVVFSADHPHQIDGTGKYLLPGLWDAHVHLTYEKALTPYMFALFLKYGVTSIRDTGGLLDLVLPEREKARKDPDNAPRVFLSGPLLDGIPVVYDGSSKYSPHLGIGAGSDAEAKKLAEEMIAAKVDLLKVYEMLSPEAFKIILATAKSNGISVTGHVPLSMDVVDASNLGLRSMEHLRNLEFACSSDWKQLLATRKKMLFNEQKETGSVLRRNIHNAQRTHALAHQDSLRRTEVLKHLAENETWQIPTLTVMTLAADLFFTRPDWQDSFKHLPDSLEKKWRTNSLNFAKRPVSEDTKNYASWMLEMIGYLKAANVDMMAGTDCPIFYLTPGYSLHEELALLVRGGLTPLEAIGTATIKPAEYFNMEDELGLVQEDMFADLLLLDANPLDDIRNTLKINTVIRNGKVHDLNALESLGLLKDQ